MEQSAHSGQGPKFAIFLAGKAFLDPDFRAMLLENPQAAANQFGIHLTPTQVEHIKTLDSAAVDEWVNGFEGYTDQDVMAMSAW